MAETTNRFKIIRFLREMEETANELYTVFSEKFPEERDFWLDIAKEETEHASVISMLGASIAEGSASFDENRFTVEEINSTLEWAKGKVTEAKKGDISEKEALSISLKLEEKILESSYFEVFIPKTEGIRDFISGVIKATERHRDKVRQKLNRS